MLVNGDLRSLPPERARDLAASALRLQEPAGRHSMGAAGGLLGMLSYSSSYLVMVPLGVVAVMLLSVLQQLVSRFVQELRTQLVEDSNEPVDLYKWRSKLSEPYAKLGRRNDNSCCCKDVTCAMSSPA